MIIQFSNDATADQIAAVEDNLLKANCKSTQVRTQFSHYLIGVGAEPADIRGVGILPGVKDVHRVSDAYKLVSRKWKLDHSAVQIDADLAVGNGSFSVMAGPCSIESEEQVREVAAHLQQAGVKVMRGGVYKPRSSPYSFRGLGLDGLRMWSDIAREHDLRIVTEVMMVEQIEPMLPYVDIFQVGARNAQNFNLLDALGQVDKPVLLKRSMSGTIDELLQSAEYIFSNGNERILLCERGIRTYEKAYRNCLDVNAIAMLKEKTHLPVIVDPSHGIGIRQFVSPVGLAGVMAGADGMIMEVHPCPEKAFSDGQQTLNFAEAQQLYKAIQETVELRDRLI